MIQKYFCHLGKISIISFALFLFCIINLKIGNQYVFKLNCSTAKNKIIKLHL